MILLKMININVLSIYILVENVIVNAPKSYKSGSDQSEWKEFTEMDKKRHREELVRNYGKGWGINQNRKESKGELEKQIPSYKQQRNDGKFTQHLDQSQQVSLSDSHQQQAPPPLVAPQQQKPSPQASKKTTLNVLLLGAASTGKTTYMQCYLRQFKKQNTSQNKSIKDHTQKITCIKSQQLISNINLDFYIIDTPGYTHGTIQKYVAIIQQEIETRRVRTDRARRNLMTKSAVFQSQDRIVLDERVHCCLFFFRGPRLHSDDWLLLSRLHDKCNFIPIIAKGDCYTIEEVLELKKNIREKAAEKGIEWFNIEQYMRQKHPKDLQLVTRGPYGLSPPFMIACSTTQVDQGKNVKIGRQYKWGTCSIEDDKHTEFKTLNKLLTKYLHTGFVKMIDIMDDMQKERDRTKIMNGEEKEGNGSGKGEAGGNVGVGKKDHGKRRWGAILGMGFGVALLVIFTKKLGQNELLRRQI